MQLNSHTKALIFSILFLGLVLLAFIFLYRKIDANEKKSEAILSEWQNEVSKYNEIKSLNNSVKIITDQKNLLENHFAQSSDVVPFLNMIEKLGLDSGTQTLVTSVEIAADKTSLLVGIKTSGVFETVYKFLTLLENSPYELEFISMDIKKINNQSTASKNINTLSWEGSFKIRLLTFIQ